MCFEHVRIKMEPVTNAIVYLIEYNINFGALHYFNGIHIVISGYRCSAGIRINFCDATKKYAFLIGKIIFFQQEDSKNKLFMRIFKDC